MNTFERQEIRILHEAIYEAYKGYVDRYGDDEVWCDDEPESYLEAYRVNRVPPTAINRSAKDHQEALHILLDGFTEMIQAYEERPSQGYDDEAETDVLD